MSRQQNRSFELGDYNDVASRIAEFRDKYPDGRLRPVNPEHPYRVETIGSETFIVYTAAAYRGSDDTLPGIGVAQEGFPGRTPYTRGSEVQNAETSAWGRAIVAALAADTRKGIASAEEVRNRQADQEAEWESARPATIQQVGTFDELAKSISDATSWDGVLLVGAAAAEARGSGAITPSQYRTLNQQATERRRDFPQDGAP